MRSFLYISLFLFAFSASAQESKKEKIETLLKAEESAGYAGSVLVAYKGEILMQSGFGFADRENNRKQTSETVFSIGSVTKQFTAAAILKLEDQRKLNVNDRLVVFFPDIPADKKDITLHQLLTHTAGFAGALGDDYDTLDSKEFAALALQSRLLHTPGTKYHYSNVGYSLLGIIVRKVSGKNYEEFVHEELFKPSGMMRTGYVIPAFKKEDLAVGYRDGNRWGTALDHNWKKGGPGWHLRANGGILSTVGDMHRWYRALKSNQVLSKQAIEKMFTPHVSEGPQQISFYGYGWVVQKMEKNTLIWHNGGNGVYNAYVGFDPEQDLFIIVSSNSNNRISDDIAAEIYNIVSGRANVRIQAGEEPYRNNPVTKKVVEVLLDKGPEHFYSNYKQILTSAGFDFENDMQLLGAGEQLEEQKKWDEAIALFQVYTKLFPDIVVAWNRLGVCYKQKGDLEKAKACWEKSVSIRAGNNRAVEWLEEIR